MVRRAQKVGSMAAGMMVQRLWFRALWWYVRTGLHVYFRKIEVHGSENIPSGGVIFTPNHQNALADALLLICHTQRPVHSLARASIFKSRAMAWLLGTINMMPVFRVRDGMSSIANNNDIFAKCCRLVANGGSLLIFPEGDHNMKRRVPPLSKGFSRIAFGAQQVASADAPVHVVPVSINYSRHEWAGSSVSIYFGKALPVASYMPQHEQEEHTKALQFRQAVSDSIAANLVQVPEPYQQQEAYLRAMLGERIIDPRAVEKCLAAQQSHVVPKKSSKGVMWRRMGALVGYVINIVPIMLLGLLVQRLTKHPIFHATLKIGIGIFFFPLVYWLEWWLLSVWIDEYAVWLWPVSIAGVLSYTKL